MDKVAYEYKVIGKKKESSTVTTLHLMPVDGPKPSFISGQFITIYFPELGIAEGKAYSISSPPHEDALSVSVKELGAYSKKISSMDVGSTLRATGPYGFFYSEEEETHLVMIAGGIGIAPFRSLILSCLAVNEKRRLTLYYSVPSLADAAFVDELFSLQEKHQNFSLTLHSTQEVPGRKDVHQGRISTGDLFQEYEQDQNTEYLVCGSIPFVRDMWKGLKEKGVPEEKIYTEAFFS